MPALHEPQELRDIVFEHRDYIEADEELSSAEAGNLVLKTFQDYERERDTNQVPRWNKADRLYFGWVKQRYWPGSKNKKRSSLPVQVVFDHLESAYPHVAGALFSQQDWFEVLPDLGSTVAQAQAKQARLSYVLEQQSREADRIGITGVSECKRALRSAMHYGNGYGKVGYDPVAKAPYIEYLSIRDVYLPPDCGEWIDKAPNWIERKLMTVEDLRDLRDFPGMNIPDDATLNSLAKNRTVDADWTRSNNAALRDITEDPGRQDQDPIKQLIEVLIYESTDRIIWLLGRKWVAFNAPNQWGVLTLVGSQYMPVLDSQYGQSFGDLLESEQKLIQSCTNAYLDDIALNLDKPRVASHGALSAPSQLLALRPGGLYKAQKPSEDFQPQVTGMVTNEIFVAIGAAQGRANVRTGVNDLMQQGVPTPSNANRTATGFRGQVQSSAMRLFTPIDTFETRFLVPALLKLDRIIAIIESRGESVVPGRDPKGGTVAVSSGALAAPVSFKLSAGSKIRAKEALMPILPFLLQYLLNPQLVQAMQAIGKAPNIIEIDRMVQEASGTAHRYEFFRDMTPQEMQQRQAAGQPEQQQDMEKAKMEAQTRLEISRQKNETTLKAKEMDLEGISEKIALEVLKLLKQEGTEALGARVSEEEMKTTKETKGAKSGGKK